MAAGVLKETLVCCHIMDEALTADTDAIVETVNQGRGNNTGVGEFCREAVTVLGTGWCYGRISV